MTFPPFAAAPVRPASAAGVGTGVIMSVLPGFTALSAVRVKVYFFARSASVRLPVLPVTCLETSSWASTLIVRLFVNSAVLIVDTSPFLSPA